jgi:large subunit ribosomal protein L27
MGRDFTIFAKVPGKVVFKRGFKGRTFVGVQPESEAAE